MSIIRITSKRQATLPKALCDEMGLQPGDSLSAERLSSENGNAWVLRPFPSSHKPRWVGALRHYATGKAHDMESIRQSIQEGRARATE